MNNLDKIINPIPINENLKKAIFYILNGILVGFYLFINDKVSYKELKRKFEYKKYEITFITKCGMEYRINSKEYIKYVNEKGPEYILQQIINYNKLFRIDIKPIKYGEISNINIQRKEYKNLIEFIKYNKNYIKQLINESNKRYQLKEDEIVGFRIRLRYKKVIQ